MVHRSIARITVALSLAAGVAQAQSAVVDTVTEPRTPAKMALVQELMQAGDFRGQFVRTIRASSAKQASANESIPAEFWTRFIARAEKDADELLQTMVEDYARYYTAAQLRELIAFYRTSAGQRMIIAAPVIGANSSAAGQAWGQRVGTEVMQELMAADAPKDAAPAKPAAKPARKP